MRPLLRTIGLLLLGISTGVFSAAPTTSASPSAGPNEDDLADIYCLRIVATNPVVEPGDADHLVDYLERQLVIAYQ